MSLKDAERELVRMRKELRAFEDKERAFAKRVEAMRHNARKAALVSAPGLDGWRAVRTATVKKGDVVRRVDGTQHTVTGTSYSRPRNQYTIYFAVPGSKHDVGLTYKRREMHLVRRQALRSLAEVLGEAGLNASDADGTCAAADER